MLVQREKINLIVFIFLRCSILGLNWALLLVWRWSELQEGPNRMASDCGDSLDANPSLAKVLSEFPEFSRHFGDF